LPPHRTLAIWLLSALLVACTSSAANAPATPAMPVVAPAPTPLPGWQRYVNTREAAAAAQLETKFVAFSLNYPTSWNRSAGDGNFLKLEKKTPDGATIESIAVSWSELSGDTNLDKLLFRQLSSSIVQTIPRAFQDARKVEEGETRFGVYPAYQVGFEAREGSTPLLGRVFVVPNPRPGTRLGLTVTVLASPASGLVQVAQVGQQGETARIIESLRFD
jgi:hypothetical protein